MNSSLIPIAMLTVLLAQDQGVEPHRVVLADNPQVFDGVIKPHRIIRLGAAADGILEMVAVERGDRVTRGQVIARLESSVEKATLELTEARSATEGTLKKQRTLLSYNTDKLRNDERLYDQGVLSTEEIGKSRTEVELARARVLEAQENQALARLEHHRARAALSRRTIKSPIDGIITRRLLSPGESVIRSLSATIVEIAETHPLRIEILLPEEMFRTIDKGSPAAVDIRLVSRTGVRARVAEVDGFIDPETGVFRVQLEIPNKDGSLAPGLKCRVRFGEGKDSGR